MKKGRRIFASKADLFCSDDSTTLPDEEIEEEEDEEEEQEEEQLTGHACPSPKLDLTENNRLHAGNVTVIQRTFFTGYGFGEGQARLPVQQEFPQRVSV